MRTNDSLFTLRTLLIVTVSAVVMYIFVTSVQNNRLYELELVTRAQIAEQETTLVAIAEIVARNGADAVTESIVKDCTLAERTEFNALLGSLNSGLARSELVELERLFGRCGSFFAERKSVMVARLSREIGVYESFIEQAATIAGRDVSGDFKLAGWQTLSELETKQSDLFSELVQLQDEIIVALLTQEEGRATSLTDIQDRVTEVQENLTLANKQAATVREELFEL